MGIEIDLLENYPKSKRDPHARAATKSESDRAIARRFDKDFFDGDRSHGYGGFSYNPRFWSPVVPAFVEFYNIKPGFKILDVGCAKGFMVFDFLRLCPGIEAQGVDISSYAIKNCLPEVSSCIQIADARDLPFSDDSFDLVISINTLHNLDGSDLKKAFEEVSRVSKKHSFVTVDAFSNDVEKEAMMAWNLTAKTIMSTESWVRYFKEVGYVGDYFWFKP